MVRPLLQRHADLALIGRLIVVRPVRHHLRGVVVDRTSSADRVRPCWFIDHICKPRPSFHISWGADLYRRPKALWDTTDPQMARDLCDAIEATALPILRAIETFEDYLAAVARSERRHLMYDSPTTRVVIEIAQGDLDAARQSCAEVSGYPDPSTYKDEFSQLKVGGAKRLCELLATGDRVAAIRLLHEWEAASVRNLKLEGVWEPTPFPIERG